MKLLYRWVCAPALVVLLLGCETPQPQKIDFQLTAEVLDEGPPKAAGGAIRTLDQVSSYPEIRIDPETAVGYENLTPDVRELYGPEPRAVSLNDVIQQTLAHNRDIKIEGYTLQVADYQIPISKSIYDLTLRASAQATKSKSQNQLDLETLEAESLAGLEAALAANQASRAALDQALMTALPELTTQQRGDLVDALEPELIDPTGVPGFATSFFGGSNINLSRSKVFGASVGQLLPTGAVVEFAYDVSRQFIDPNRNRINPLYSQAMTLSVSQPLLRGFGQTITNADIEIANLSQRASSAEFEIQVQNQIRQALETYWDLVFEVQRYDVVVIAYTAALDLLRINNAKVAAGVMAQTEALQAKASVEARREALIRARQRVRDAEDSLKQLMFFQDDTPNWDLELLPAQKLTWREFEIDPESILVEAVAHRPEVRGAEKLLEVAGLQVFKAGDAKKPQIDLIGQAGITGIDDNISNAYDNLETADFNNFVIGLDFSFPLQNRLARYTHAQRLSEQARASERYLKLRDIVTFEVRNALRELQTSRERIEITRSRVESEQANLDAERKRYEVGVSTSFQVLEFQEDLAAAQEAHVQAIVDYNKATISLERARGTILNTYGIQFAGAEPEDEEPQETQEMFPIGFD